MTELEHIPVKHDHQEFLAKAGERKGFAEAYASLGLEYQVGNQLLKAHTKAGLTQDAVAEPMGTTKSAVSRLESTGKLSLRSARCSAMPKRWVATFNSSWCHSGDAELEQRHALYQCLSLTPCAARASHSG